MRKWLTLTMALIAAWLAINMNLPQPAAAAISATVSMDYQYAARGDPHFTVYAVSPGDDWQALQESLAAMSPAQIQAYIATEKLQALGRLTPADAQLQVAVDTPILVVADNAEQPFGESTWYGPMAIRVPAEGAKLEPKPVTVTETLYFFKYGVDQNGTSSPLAGAQFAMTRTVDGLRQWLGSSGWQNDQQAARRFTSDTSGVVSYDGPALGPGDYKFVEVKAPSGYSITRAAQNVAVRVPEAGAITVQGASLLPRLDGQLMTTAAEDSRLWIANYSGHPPLPDTDVEPPGGTTTPPTTTGGGDPPGKPGWRLPLPDTGEAKASLLLLGALLIAGAIYLWRRLSAADRKF